MLSITQLQKKQKKKQPLNRYSSTKVKARNFLTNVSYNRIKDYVNLIWSYMMRESLYNFICIEDNYRTLNKLKLKFHERNEIIKIFLENDSTQFDVLKEYLIKIARSYQCVYGNLFPIYFARIDDYSIQSKTNFNNFYKNYINQKSVFEWNQKSILLTIPDIPDIDVPPSTPLNMIELNDENVDFEK